MFNQCKMPILSFGLVVYRESEKNAGGREYLMIRRKDSFGFIDFVRGKYTITNQQHLRNNIDEMSIEEKRLIQLLDYDALTKCLMEEISTKESMIRTVDVTLENKCEEVEQDLEEEEEPSNARVFEEEGDEEEEGKAEFPGCKMNLVEETREAVVARADDDITIRPLTFGESTEENALLLFGGCGASDESMGKKKFMKLKRGLFVDNEYISIDTLVANSTTRWTETEWEFPKGRKMYNEGALTCALREFEEETGLCSQRIQIIDNLMPFEEIFVGSNNKPYKHKYFVGRYCSNETEEQELGQFQRTEVSKVEWKTCAECLQSIRNYSVTKKEIIRTVDKLLSASDCEIRLSCAAIAK